MTFVGGQRLHTSAEFFPGHWGTRGAAPLVVPEVSGGHPTCSWKRRTISASTSAPSRAHSAGLKISTSTGPR